MRILILGPVQVWGEVGPVAAGGPLQRLVLALLIDRVERVVHVDALIEGIWVGRPPGNPRKTLQVYVSNLRRVLGSSSIESSSSGYRLVLGPHTVDAHDFADVVARAHRQAATEPDAAIAAFHVGDTMWRGDVFADLPARDRLTPTIVRLQETRLTATEARLGLEVRTGRATVAIPELEEMIARHPSREQAWIHLMHALYLAGRQREALEAFQRARRHLVEEIGVEPGADLADMERQVLAHDPTLRATPAGARSSTVSVPVGRARRQVTVVCCAATGVEAMAAGRDPATVVRMMDHFRRVAAAVFGRHGGVVVASASALTLAAYFGLGTDEPEAAVAAVTAALEVVAPEAGVDAWLHPPPVRLRAQVGIDSGVTLIGGRGDGDQVTPPPAGHVLARADRLRANARPGEVLVTARTAALLDGHVVLGPSADRRPVGGDGPVVGHTVEGAGPPTA